jgi:hypothetical protein
MISRPSQSVLPHKFACNVIANLCIAFVMSVATGALAQNAPDTTAASQEAAKIPDAELDSLVAPIALYPDPLLSQTLVASTYPVELMQLQQWIGKNSSLKDQALADAAAKQPWDASIQGLAAFPDVVAKLADNVQWTSDLGNAFLAQQNDVMAAVQRMRAKAQGSGTLKTGAQQKVETQTTDSGQQAIVIEPADPNVVYVPSYDPAVVYGASEYPYPSISYPGYVPGTALAWGTGLALGAAWGGGWGYNCGWNNGDVNINYNNKYVNNANKNNPNRGQGNSWQHNPQHRGNAPYGNKQTANKFGGTARGEARPAGGAGPGGATRPAGGAGAAGGAGVAGGQGNRPGGEGAKPGGAGAGAAAKPGGGAGAGAKPGGGGGEAAKPAGGAGAGAKPGGGGGAAAKPSGGGGANKVGNQKVSSGGGGGAFGGGSGPSAKAASSRGGGSMGGGGHGGGGRGGGGGGGRGGGGGGGGRKR